MEKNLKHGNSIFTFNNGDKILRLKPVFKQRSAGWDLFARYDYLPDNSFRSPRELVDIKNNLIYLKNIEPPMSLLNFENEQTISKAALEVYWDNWGFVESEEDAPAAEPEEHFNGNNLDISELFISEGNSIHSFKPGDTIIRVKSVKRVFQAPFLNPFDAPIVQFDNSYRQPMEFIGIINNKILLKYQQDWILGNGMTSEAELEIYENNWELFQMPEGVEDLNHLRF